MLMHQQLTVLVEVGKRLVLNAKGTGAVIMAAGLAVAAVRVADKVGQQAVDAGSQVWGWLRRKLA